MGYKSIIKFVVIIPLLFIFLYSCSKDKPTEPIEPAATGTVKGYVYETGTSSPISGVIVSIGSTSDTTVSNGYYELIDIPTGSQTITANADSGYTSYSQTITVNEGDNQHNIYLAALILPDMVYVPAGEFQMGDNFNEGYSDEKPVHSVYLDAYYIGKYEVTNELYCLFLNEMGNQSEGMSTWLDINSSYCNIVENGGVYSPKTGKANHPVVEVSWYGARAYCDWLTSTTGHTYRLPTEAEWEKAARGDSLLNLAIGHQRRYPWGDNIDGSYANYLYSGDQYENGPYPWTTPVCYYDGSTHGSFMTHNNSSPYGAYDMAGNVWEWCSDRYSSGYYLECYNQGVVTNPLGPPTGSYRVLRGGNWDNSTINLRSAYRDSHSSTYTYYFLGFRCVLEY